MAIKIEDLKHGAEFDFGSENTSKIIVLHVGDNQVFRKWCYHMGKDDEGVTSISTALKEWLYFPKPKKKLYRHYYIADNGISPPESILTFKMWDNWITLHDEENKCIKHIHTEIITEF